MIGRNMNGYNRKNLPKLRTEDICKTRVCKRTDVLYSGMFEPVWRKRKKILIVVSTTKRHFVDNKMKNSQFYLGSMW